MVIRSGFNNGYQISNYEFQITFMIIGIDASRANRPHKTGTEWYSYYLIRWLAKLDQTNQYILYSDKPLNGGLADLTTEQHYGSDRGIDRQQAEFDQDGFQVIKSPNDNFKAKVLNWPFRFFWTQGRLSLEMFARKVDILFIPAHALPFIHPKKTLITIHDIGFERDRLLFQSEKMGPESAGGRRLLNFFVRLFTFNKYGANSLDYLSWSTRFGLKHADKIICVSEFTKQDIKDIYKTRGDKIKVVYNGYNRKIYRKIADREKISEVLKKYDLPEDYILYVGRLEKKKNTPALIEAYANAREKNQEIKAKLVLVGDAGFGYDEVKYAIREFSLDDEVVMPGWVEEIDMPYLFSGAAAFVFPTRYEGFGIPLLQAMACETPIAASWSSSIPEVVADAALLFNPHDINAIADALAKVTIDAAVRQDLIAKGRDRIKAFSWQKCAEETLEVIKEM